MRKLLVTGGAGFIGSHIAARLVADGRKVRIFDDFSTGKWSNLKPLAERVEVIEGDLRDRAALAKALRGCEFVYQQAALRSVPRSIDDPLANKEVNVTGIPNLLIESKSAGVRRVVYASSSMSFMNNQWGWLTIPGTVLQAMIVYGIFLVPIGAVTRFLRSSRREPAALAPPG